MNQEPLETLREIKSLMERSSRFLSLSGLSGAIAGTAALAGVAIFYIYLGISPLEPGFYKMATLENGGLNPVYFSLMLIIAFCVLIIALLAAVLLARKNARKERQPLWDATAKRLVINLGIPLVAGGIYCLILLYHGLIALAVPGTMVFYGLALINASKYTLNDIRFLGIAMILTGLAASLIKDYGLLFWAFGFGVLHIGYGITMYFKYER
ncbi:MAG TPA: putative holin-like toxin [Bacteroidales bacterium]|nr:putative holin-like toxin [Bacteroidales bacterium]